MSSWEPSPGHWEHSPAPSTRPGRQMVAHVALRGQPQPSGHLRSHQVSQAWSNIPAKVLMEAGHLGRLQSLHPSANTGPSHQLRISLKCFFLSFLHGVPRLNLTLPENISSLFPRPGGHKAQGRFLRSLPWVTAGSDCNIVLYPAQWHPYSKYCVA